MSSQPFIKLFTLLLIITLAGCFTLNKTDSSAVEATNNPSGGSQGAIGVSDNPNQNDNQQDTVEDLDDPDYEPSKYGETYEDSVQCVRSLSLYSEYYRQENYNLAYDSWQNAMEFCPRASQNLYIHGARMLKHRMDEVTEPEKEEALLDSLMWLYDKRIEHFGREGYVLGRKAVDLYTYKPDEKASDIFDYSERSIELEEEESRPDVIVINMQTAARLGQAGVLDDVEVFEVFDRALNLLEYRKEHDPERAARYERAMDQIEAMFRPFHTCETLVEAFTPRFEDNPEDVELLEQITSMLDEADCIESDLYYEATHNLHKIKPTASSAYLMGQLEVEDDEYTEAVDYYEEAVELYDEEDIDELYRTYMLKANIQFRELERYSEARNSAQEASELKPDDGRPHILIGEMYAETAEQCGDCDFTERVAYWAAVDKFEKAKDVETDPDIKNRAEELISAYSRYFPDSETIFFHGYDLGDSYRVQCWINETTTVRAR